MRRAPHSPDASAQPEGCDRSAVFATADHPGADIASPEIEAALVDLERVLCRDRSHAVVAAPAGPKGGLLARTLMQRPPGSLRVVHVAAATLRGDEICARVLDGLGQEPDHDAEACLLGFVQELERRDSALVLLIGDAGTLPAPTLACLRRLARASRSGLRLVLIVAIEPRSDGNAIAQLVAALGVGAQKVELRTQLERAQSEAPVRIALEGSELDERIAPPAARGALRPLGPQRSPPRGERPARPPAMARCAGELRGQPSRARRWPLAAIVSLGLALALLGVRLLPASTLSREVLPEPAGERGEPARSLPSAVTQPAPSRPEAETAGSEDAARSGGSVPAEVKPRPADEIRPAVATRVRSIPVSLNARPWARIEVDGRAVGVTPLANLPMAPGLHRFRAHLADGRVVERAIRVDAYHNHLSFP